MNLLARVKPLTKVKARRFMRRYRATFFQKFWGDLLDPGNAIGLLIAFVLTFGVRSFKLSPDEMAAEVQNWYDAIWAFLIVAAFWFAYSAGRSYFLTRKAERDAGEWHGTSFVYRQPLLVAILRCKATGQVEMYKVKFADAEPASYVWYTIQLDGADSIAEVGLGGKILMGPIPYKNWPGTGGFLLPQDRIAIFSIKLPLTADSTTARIYCRSFNIGDPNAKDGTTGNYEFPVRQSP